MENFRTYNWFKTYRDAFHEVRRLRDSTDADMIYKIVKSGYGDFSIVAVKSDLYADMLIGRLPWPPNLRPGSEVRYADAD